MLPTSVAISVVSAAATVVSAVDPSDPQAESKRTDAAAIAIIVFFMFFTPVNLLSKGLNGLGQINPEVKEFVGSWSLFPSHLTLTGAGLKMGQMGLFVTV
jgi:hypothetical protein